MSRLLYANFMRLKKDKFFWIGMAFMFAAGVYFPVIRYVDMKQSMRINKIDNGFFSGILFTCIIMAVFCSLFIGTEYSDGTMRNKIVSGHKRASVYLANFIASAIVSIAMSSMFFVPYLCIGIPLLGFFRMEIQLFLLFSLAALMVAVAFSSIFTLISMLCHNKTITAVLCIFSAFLLLFVGVWLNMMLSNFENTIRWSVTETGQESAEPQILKYLEEEKYNAVQFFYDFLPGGQAIQCASLEAANIERLPIYSLIIIILTTGTGVVFYQKKDLV